MVSLEVNIGYINQSTGQYTVQDKEEYKKRQEDCLRSTCERILKCKVEDVSEETKEALLEMYRWGDARKWYWYPCGLEYSSDWH